MDTLFLLLFFAPFIALIVGLVKPTTFSRFIKGEITRKKIATIFGITTVASFILFGITTDTSQNNQATQQPATENIEVTAENNITAPVVEKAETTPTPAKTEAKTTPAPMPTPPPAPTASETGLALVQE